MCLIKGNEFVRPHASAARDWMGNNNAKCSSLKIAVWYMVGRRESRANVQERVRVS